MSEGGSRPVAWRRLLFESLAIVASILLAFAIDAWWDGAQERERATALSRGLLADFESSRPLLEERVALAERLARNNALFLERIAGARPGAPVSVPDSLVIAVIGGPTYEATTDVLDAAVSSGEIALLRNESLRRELASWRRGLTDTAEDERETRRITNEQVVPALAGVLDLAPYFGELLAWSGSDPKPAPGSATFRLPTELSGLLSLRLFYGNFAAADLADLLAILDRIVELLLAELAP